MSRLLLDENLSPAVGEALRARGHDAVHVNEVGLHHTADPVIMLWAASQGRTVVTHDHDYLDNLWTMRAGAPSVIKLVQRDPHGIVGTEAQVSRLAAILPTLERHLKVGTVVVMDRTRVTRSPLPLERRFRGARAPDLGRQR